MDGLDISMTFMVGLLCGTILGWWLERPKRDRRGRFK